MDKTTALGLWRYAKEFAEAGRVVSHIKGGEPFIPTYYLFAHGIELVLKAFLRSQGVDLKKLRDIGHDLEGALEEAQNHGLGTHVTLRREDVVAIKMINSFYKNKELEYITTGFKSLPELLNLNSALEMLLEGTSSVCKKKLPG